MSPAPTYGPATLTVYEPSVSFSWFSMASTRIVVSSFRYSSMVRRTNSSPFSMQIWIGTATPLATVSTAV